MDYHVLLKVLIFKFYVEIAFIVEGMKTRNNDNFCIVRRFSTSVQSNRNSKKNCFVASDSNFLINFRCHLYQCFPPETRSTKHFTSLPWASMHFRLMVEKKSNVKSFFDTRRQRRFITTCDIFFNDLKWN